MRIIIANNGLGNTMFQYALTIALRKEDNARGVSTAFYAPKSNFPDHNGYELLKVFNNVKPLDGLNLLQRIYIKIAEKILPATQNQRRKLMYYKLLFAFRQRFITTESILYYPETYSMKNRNAYYIGFFQSFRYFERCRNDILDAFSFSEEKLSDKSKKISLKMQECNSVALHIRRGDYLKPHFVAGFGACCNLDYYRRAIEYIYNHVDNPHFFLFSDDPDWVKNNLKIDGAVVIDFNVNTDSWQDLYLMTQCRHNVIANSSFSWWGAWLGTQEDKIIIAPKRWWATLEHDDIIPDDWIRI